MYDIVLCFITAFALTYLAIPSIIKIAKKKHLYDYGDNRKSHTGAVPTLGGIAMFAGVLFSIVLWTPFEVFGDAQYIICSFIIIFLVGAKDDIDPISPTKKFLGQLFASFILVFKANIQLTSLYGIFGIYAIPYYPSMVLSMFTILVIINAFNLIDGINGLSASLAAMISVTLGSWFFLIDEMQLSLTGFALAGAAIAFLKFNITPAKIFMGDTGAMLSGIIVAILAIKFIEDQQKLPLDSPYFIQAAPAVAVGIMFLPLFDTLRVIVIRIFKRESPFHADRLHIHHMMIDVGFTHMQSTSILLMVNLLFILIVLKYQSVGNFYLLLIILGIALLFTAMLYMFLTNKRKTITSNETDNA